jgi:hypothetical protein
MENWEASFRKQALDLGVTVTEIDRKPLEAALTGLYTKVTWAPRPPPKMGRVHHL